MDKNTRHASKCPTQSHSGSFVWTREWNAGKVYCRIVKRDVGSGIKVWDQGTQGSAWCVVGYSPELRDHRPWNRGQQLFEGSKIRLYTVFVGLGNKICLVFRIKDQKFEDENVINCNYLALLLRLQEALITSRRS